MIESTLNKMAAWFGMCALLSGCALDPASRAMNDLYRLMHTEAGAAQLNPSLSYLRLQTGGREIFMALGYVDQTPDGPVEVWYSGEADVLRLRDGRVIGATMKRGVNWLAVSFSSLPSWDAVVGESWFDRVRDESPGYRYGIAEKLRIRPIAAPADSQLKNIPPASLSWFEESVQGDTGLPSARYAVKSDSAAPHRVIYAEQCLSSEYCFSWQVWPSSNKGTH